MLVTIIYFHIITNSNLHMGWLKPLCKILSDVEKIKTIHIDCMMKNAILYDTIKWWGSSDSRGEVLIIYIL